jgi:hypothetical protein
MARPRKPINPGQVEKLAKLGCSQAEIGEALGCSRFTLMRRFATALKKGYAEMKLSLRKAQFDAAVKGKNVTMQIWLGKQILGQRNEPSTAVETDKLDELLQEFRAINARDTADGHGDT